jgi:hypothetical protein
VGKWVSWELGNQWFKLIINIHRMSSFSIIPEGFESTAHPIFKHFEPPKLNKRPRNQPPTTSKIGGENTTSNIKEMIGATDTTCPICLCTYRDPVTICGCTHSFCRYCLERWLAVNDNCPLCKLEILVFISAEPGSSNQQLFSRSSITDAAVSANGDIVGMSEAVQMQSEIYSRLNEVEISDHNLGENEK